MALKEQDIVLTTKDAAGNTVIQMPITRAKNVEDLIDLVYPVGAIYMSTVGTSPATLFGGTWEALDDGRVLIGANNTYQAGTTGGEASHTLTVGEMPSHTHEASTGSAGAHTHTRGTQNITGSVGGWYSGGCDGSVFTDSGGTYDSSTGSGTNYKWGRKYNFNANGNWSGSTNSSGAHSHTVTVNNTGSGTAHNNMQPYLAVYMWKRTA